MNVNLLDKVMNLVGELVLVRNQILQFSLRQQESGFLSTSQRLNLITSELQEGIMKTRMQPIGNIWNKFPRIVRDLALACGKQVRIEMEGEETELDKTLIEAIRDPLTHIVRNSIDHGIELPQQRVAAGKPAEGRLFLRALHESGQVIIEVADDGAGIDVERVRAKALERGLITADQAAHMSEGETLKLVFLPGFSTAQKITNISGRGVGMDVVKTNIEKIGGTVDIQSARGQGARLRIKIPLTLAIIPALIVTCAGDRYAIPQISLIELVRLEAEEKAQQDRADSWRAGLSPARQPAAAGLSARGAARCTSPLPRATAAAHRASHIVVLQVADQQFGLVVDQVSDTEEIVVKPLGKQFKGLSAFAGATIMGDGRVALILDVPGAAQLSGVLSFRDSAHAEKQDAAARSKQQTSAPAAMPRGKLRAYRGAAGAGFAPRRIHAGANRACRRMPGGALSRSDSAAGRSRRCCSAAAPAIASATRFRSWSSTTAVIIASAWWSTRSSTSSKKRPMPPSSAAAPVCSVPRWSTRRRPTSSTCARCSKPPSRAGTTANRSKRAANGSILLIDQSGFSRGLVRSYLEMAGPQRHRGQRRR